MEITTKLRLEFETWALGEFDIDCTEMTFGMTDNDKMPCYSSNDGDEDGAVTVSAMLYAYVAGALNRAH